LEPKGDVITIAGIQIRKELRKIIKRRKAERVGDVPEGNCIVTKAGYLPQEDIIHTVIHPQPDLDAK